MMQRLLDLHSKFVKSKEQMKAELDEVFQAIFGEYPDIKNLFILGTTPSFNDGEPCEHTQRVAINVNVESENDENDPEHDDSEEFTIFDSSGNACDLENGSCWAVLESGLKRQEEEAYKPALDLLKSLVGHFQALYGGTSFYVFVVRGEDGISYKVYNGYADEGY